MKWVTRREASRSQRRTRSSIRPSSGRSGRGASFSARSRSCHAYRKGVWQAQMWIASGRGLTPCAKALLEDTSRSCPRTGRLSTARG
jgi:hypothetical protein